MKPSIYWLGLGDGWRLAIMPRPRAGDWLTAEVAGWKAEGIDCVVSLLEEHEIVELGLQELSSILRSAAIELISFPIPDRGVPASIGKTGKLIRRLSEAVADGNAVAVHCRAGIGRSALIAACVLARNGYDVKHAFDTISKARGVAVPDTQAQRDWVSAFLAASV